MDIKKLRPVIWEIVEKNKKCSVNVSNFDNKVTVVISCGQHKERFTNGDERYLLAQLHKYLAA